MTLTHTRLAALGVLLAGTCAVLAAPTASAAQSPAMPDTASEQEPLASFDQLPIEQAAAPRCGVAFALVGRWQKEGDSRGAEYPDMVAAGGREFFVRAMARLMDEHELDRLDVSRLVLAEGEALAADQGAGRLAAMMPACLLLKDAAGL